LLAQAVILCGGLGTRLGDLTATTPKPMLKVAGRPFIEHILQEVARYGIGRILLLAGRFGEQIQSAYHGKTLFGAQIEVLIEPTPLGTGGALRFAADHLDASFLLLNGDSWIDADLVALARSWQHARQQDPALQAQLLLKTVPDAGRFGTVSLQGDRVTEFREKSPASSGQPGLINGGVYILDRRIVALAPAQTACSLESDMLPVLVKAGHVTGVAAAKDAYFIDIGLPETFSQSQQDLARHRSRPALFLDRDDTLNIDLGHTHRPEDLRWTPEAREAIKYANDAGYYVFVVTNQSGVARGLYDDAAVQAFHAAMQASLFEIGAHIDALDYCPHHPDGTVAHLAKACHRRKPGPGMILDLAATWPVDLSKSLLIGNAETDVQAAEAAGIKGLLYTGGSLLDLVKKHLPLESFHVDQ
jgi:D,D-heptose 1,7-bisphosphate phosphatase